MLPPPLQPAVVVLQTIVPLVGYIGAFIAWSWGAIKDFDKGALLHPSHNSGVRSHRYMQGNGVILTATWILPIALIPGTWDAANVPKTQPQPSSSNGTTPPAGDSKSPAPANSKAPTDASGKTPPVCDGKAPTGGGGTMPPPADSGLPSLTGRTIRAPEPNTSLPVKPKKKGLFR